jgi:glycosyltransferase involved in cell wall biosynthesis
VSSPRVSVVIPTYNQANYLGKAIQSVLDQIHLDWELIVVDDGSTDSTAMLMDQIGDARVRYLRQSNQGPSAARNAGIANTQAEYLSFLDADDTYHPYKLQAQVDFLDARPEVGLAYTSRIETDQLGNRLNFVRAPARATLETLVLGFPFSMNDLMVRRSWVQKVGAFDVSLAVHEDRELFTRLSLAGCQFAGSDRFLTHRRLYSNRAVKNLAAKLETMTGVLERIFADPRCPGNVRDLRNKAYATIYLSWSYQEFMQGEISPARSHLIQAVQLDSSLLVNRASALLTFLVFASIRDGGDHEASLRKVFEQLPQEMAWLSADQDGAVARGYLERAAREVIWGRLEQGRMYFNQAEQRGAQGDDFFWQGLTYQLLCFAREFGDDAAQQVLYNLNPLLRKVGGEAGTHRLEGYYSVNRAFESFRQGQYARAISNALKAIWKDPRYLGNRGVLSVLLHSALGLDAN